MTTKSPEAFGLYIHIPFCHARCGYCDFVTFTGKEDKVDEYVTDLCNEIGHYAASPVITTVFFGGGTPSILESRHLKQIFQAIDRYLQVAPNAEITLEANPESVTAEKAAGWKEIGVNRISLGLQALDDGLLKKMDRLHNVQQFLEAYQTVRKAGFENVSIDLIYGFAEQTLENWIKTVEGVCRLGPDHLSLYALKIEDHTPFAARGYRIDDDAEAEMYDWARTYLARQGYAQYEISNFSRNGKDCRHNLIYWRQQDYLGVGVGAVGCVGGLRWENQKTLHAYHADLLSQRLPRASVEDLDDKTRRFERLMLGLRLREGLNWPEDNPDWIGQRALLLSKGHLEEVRPGYWRIPEQHVALTNQILLSFLS